MKSDELEEAKRKVQAKCNDLQEALDVAYVKIGSLEKNRSKLIGELDDAQV